MKELIRLSSITKQHVGKYTHLYDPTSYRAKQGRSRNHKTLIGKIDQETGATVYTTKYLSRMAAADAHPARGYGAFARGNVGCQSVGYQPSLRQSSAFSQSG